MKNGNCTSEPKPGGINPNANHREIWLQDLNGYVVV
jgi:hypothetical protein